MWDEVVRGTGKGGRGSGREENYRGVVGEKERAMGWEGNYWE